MQAYVASWAVAFAVTQAVEAPIYARAIGAPYRRAFAIGFGASLLTHPPLWFVIPRYVEWGPTTWAVSEVAVTLVEAAWLWTMGAADRSPTRVLGLAVIANGASILVGESLRLFVDF